MSLLKEAWGALVKVASLTDKVDRHERELSELRTRCRELERDVTILKTLLGSIRLPVQTQSVMLPLSDDEGGSKSDR